MKKTITRRRFTGLALLGIPSASVLLAQGRSTPQEGAGTGDLQLQGVKVPDALKQDVRKALHKAERKIAVLRTYKVDRDTQPALILGAFDEPRTFAVRGDPDAG